jgi:hypothetical protein
LSGIKSCGDFIGTEFTSQGDSPRMSEIPVSAVFFHEFMNSRGQAEILGIQKKTKEMLILSLLLWYF